VTGVLAVGMKELRQIRCDGRSLMILLFLPAFFLLLYGYALNFDIRHVPLAVEDRDRTADSRRLVAAFERSTYFDVVAHVSRAGDAPDLVDRDRARAVLVIPGGYARDLAEARRPEVQVILNGDNANTAATVLGYVTAVLGEAAVGARMAAEPAVVRAVPRVWYNPELRSTLFLVPGLIAYIAMITAVVSTALSIVREKERGTMEQIRMAPLSNLAFVLGKTLPYLVLSQASAMLVILAAMALFGMPMTGHWGTLSLLLAVFLVGALGTGLFVSTMADTQQVAFQAAMVIAFLPTFMLSGFIFPIRSMPAALQVVTTIVPARHLLIALRGVLLKGHGLLEIWPSLLALSGYAAVVLGLSAVRVRRQ
jgi:ABC-2 type transport system permease protein